MDTILKSKEQMSAADMKKLKELEKDPIMSQLLNKLIESRIETAIKESKEKPICPSAVIVSKKNAQKALESTEEEDKIPLFISAIGPDGKEQIYTHCTRPTYKKEKYCWKHCQVSEKKPDNIIPFEKIKEDVKSRPAELGDEIFTVTSTKQTKETLNFLRTKELVNIFAKAIGHTGAVNINIQKKEKKVAEDDADADEDADEDADDDEDKDDDEDEDETSCKEIMTSDGRKLYLDEATDTVYSPEGDDAGKELGTLKTVSDKTTLEIDGEFKIVANEVKYNKKDYYRCALSDVLYQDIAGDDKLVNVGKVALQKNGEYKVTLTAAPKKAAPAAKKDSPTAKKATTTTTK